MPGWMWVQLQGGGTWEWKGTSRPITEVKQSLLFNSKEPWHECGKRETLEGKAIEV